MRTFRALMLAGTIAVATSGCSIAFHNDVSLKSSIKRGKCPKIWPVLTDLGLMLASVTPLFFLPAPASYITSLSGVSVFAVSSIAGAAMYTGNPPPGTRYTCKEQRRPAGGYR